MLVQDNLNIHSKASLYEAFPAAEARRLVERFEWHYTPKHGSWLDLAESELGVLSAQCLDRRIPDKQTLIDEITAWEHDRNANHSKSDWHISAPNIRLQDGSLAERIRDDLETTAFLDKQAFCRAARGKQISIALMMPGAPSEVTRSGSFRPRLFMSSKDAVTVSASSLEPAIMCSSTRRPSIVKPQAARTGSRLAPGRKRSAMPSTNRWEPRTIPAFGDLCWLIERSAALVPR